MDMQTHFEIPSATDEFETLVRAHTHAPLRMRGTFEFDAPSETVFERVTDPELIGSWFGMVKGGYADHSSSQLPGEWGAGSKRYCQTSGMGTLDETILHWDAPRVCAYNVKSPMMPIKDHVALMVVEPRADGATFHWHQYFNYKGLLMRHLFPSMMLTMMNDGLAKLAKQIGGPGGRMKSV